ncbi:hypothetical protein OUZ56_027503 [Daphnia magna]|uniref:Uncharacterized protein n=1 Tax=Daphnia magna TaxID=35525 RepID=A0ABQ9ZPY3_9CRUS|nr:hypothetical protein OUZ56_027503 [Daphnia magna]
MASSWKSNIKQKKCITKVGMEVNASVAVSNTEQSMEEAISLQNFQVVAGEIAEFERGWLVVTTVLLNWFKIVTSIRQLTNEGKRLQPSH